MWQALLIALGYAIGANDAPEFRVRVLRLVNSINEGNPNFTPYAVPPER